ncbi:MAG: phenylalanine 4-monooxygenase [Actinomycetes bacterium]
MFEEAQLYAPVTQGADGNVEVQLSADHPGVNDPVYRARRNSIAALALAWTPGTPVPHAEYTDEEHEVWREVSRELAVLHRTLACREYLVGAERLRLPADRIPQLDEVTAALEPLTGFRYAPAAGLVPLREFYGSLADSRFYSTQYIRHHSVPLYTPEPDVVHEVVGHANCLASDRFAALYRSAGNAARRVEQPDALEFVSKVFWFSLEFGVLREDGTVRTYGAGLLSSYGEIQQIARADLRPLDIARMGVQTYDITHYQPLLFCADSFQQVEDVVGGFFDSVDDDSVARLQAVSAAS